MSPRLLPITPREALRKLKRGGFLEHHQRGSHLVLKHTDGRMVVLPHSLVNCDRFCCCHCERSEAIASVVVIASGAKQSPSLCHCIE